MSASMEPQPVSKPRRHPTPRDEGMANIVTATIALLDAKDPGDLTIRDIAAASGHHHRLIIEWFGNKGGLMQAVSEHILQSVVDSGELFSSTIALRADVRKAFRIFNYMQMNYPEFVASIEGRFAADAVVERLKAVRGMSDERARLAAETWQPAYHSQPHPDYPNGELRVGASAPKGHPLHGCSNATKELRRDLNSRYAELMRLRTVSMTLTQYWTVRRASEIVSGHLDWLTPGENGCWHYKTPREKSHQDTGADTLLVPTQDERLDAIAWTRRWLDAIEPYRTPGCTEIWPEVLIISGVITAVSGFDFHAARQRTTTLRGDLSDAEWEKVIAAQAVDRLTSKTNERFQALCRHAGIEAKDPDRSLSSHSNRRGPLQAMRNAGHSILELNAAVRHKRLDTTAQYTDAPIDPSVSPVSKLGL